jgi:hypothetical protein
MIRFVLVAVAAVGLAWLAFTAARHWPAQSTPYPRPDGIAGCQLEAGACRQRVGDASVEMRVTPEAIPLMETLSVTVRLEAIDATGVRVDIRGLNMDMGLNRIRLSRLDGGQWRGETILPVCSQRRMEWEAAVLIDGERPMSVPFLFSTTRP